MILTCNNNDCSENVYWTTYGYCPNCGVQLSNPTGIEKQKIGIIFDNYKTRIFKRAITKAGFEFEIKPYTQGTSAMFIETTKDRVSEIEKICKKCQIDIHKSN